MIPTITSIQFKFIVKYNVGSIPALPATATYKKNDIQPLVQVQLLL